MAIDAISWALAARDLRASEKFVLVVLAKHYGGRSPEVWPSVRQISELTCLDRKTVLAALKKLIGSGQISDSGRRVGRTHQGIVYRLNFFSLGSVTISGTATQGQVLSAGNTLADADGVGTINYQWKADGTEISGATSSTYTLTEAQVGKTITVVASYLDGHGYAESVTSNATSAVANLNDAPAASVKEIQKRDSSDGERVPLFPPKSTSFSAKESQKRDTEVSMEVLTEKNNKPEVELTADELAKLRKAGLSFSSIKTFIGNYPKDAILEKASLISSATRNPGAFLSVALVKNWQSSSPATTATAERQASHVPFSASSATLVSQTLETESFSPNPEEVEAWLAAIHPKTRKEFSELGFSSARLRGTFHAWARTANQPATH